MRKDDIRISSDNTSSLIHLINMNIRNTSKISVTSNNTNITNN